jgi:hypothetical protein
MQKIPTVIAACALCLLIGLGGCAANKDAADPGFLQRMETALARATPTLKVSIQASAKQGKSEETTTVRVASATAGFVYLLQLDSDGRALRLVFPNATDDANFMGTGYIDLPRGNWRMPTRSQGGTAHLMAIVSPTQIDLPALQAQLAYGKFELTGTYGAAMIPLR